MTPFEVTNPKRRLQAHRRIAIKRLADLRAEFPNPKPDEVKLIQNAKETVKELQNAKI